MHRHSPASRDVANPADCTQDSSHIPPVTTSVVADSANSCMTGIVASRVSPNSLRKQPSDNSERFSTQATEADPQSLASSPPTSSPIASPSASAALATSTALAALAASTAAAEKADTARVTVRQENGTLGSTPSSYRITRLEPSKAVIPRPLPQQAIAVELCTPPTSVTSLDLKKEYAVSVPTAVCSPPLTTAGAQVAADVRAPLSGSFISHSYSEHDVERRNMNPQSTVKKPSRFAVADVSPYKPRPSFGFVTNSSHETIDAPENPDSVLFNTPARHADQSATTGSLQMQSVDVHSSIMSQVTEADISSANPSVGHELDDSHLESVALEPPSSADSRCPAQNQEYPLRCHWPPHLPVCNITAEDFERLVDRQLAITTGDDLKHQETNSYAIARELLDALAALSQQLPLKTSTRLFSLFSRSHFLNTLIDLLTDKSQSQAVTTAYLSTQPYTSMSSVPVSVARTPIASSTSADMSPSNSGAAIHESLDQTPDSASSINQGNACCNVAGDRFGGDGAVTVASPTALLRAKQEYDARGSYTYPFLVARILAYGSQDLRHSVLSSPDVMRRISSILCDASVDPALAAHVVPVLDSFMEFSPIPVLQSFADTANFMDYAILNLHISQVASLFAAIVPAPGSPTDILASSVVAPHLAGALRILTTTGAFPRLVETFEKSNRKIARVLSVQNADDSSLPYDDIKRVENIAECVACMMTKLTPVLRVHQAAAIDTVRILGRGQSLSSSLDLLRAARPDIVKAIGQLDSSRTLSDEQMRDFLLDCAALDIFENSAATGYLASMFDSAWYMFMESNYRCSAPLYAVVDCVVKLLDALRTHRSQRLHSLTEQPPPLRSAAFEDFAISRLHHLVQVLVHTAKMEHGIAACRIRIFDYFVAAQRTCNSEKLYEVLTNINFSEVALKFLRLRKRNSVLHSIVASSVETALLSDNATDASRAHWLCQARLIDEVQAGWVNEGGWSVWSDPKSIQERPYLSAVVHMACCILHLRNMDEQCIARLVGNQKLLEFDDFCNDTIAKILASETRVLGGAHPPRRKKDRSFHQTSSSPFDTSSSSLRRSNSLSSFSSTASSRPARSLVKSPSAHRFGYVEPAASESKRRSSRLESLFSLKPSVDFDAPRRDGASDSLVAVLQGCTGSSDIGGRSLSSSLNAFQSLGLSGGESASGSDSSGVRDRRDDLGLNDFERDDIDDDFGAIHASSLR